MNIETILVTPELAQEWLATNTENNRRISKVTVRRYTQDMMQGKWKATGETIKFDAAGRLIDGQHRLSAVVASGASVEMLVIRDLSTDAIQVIDTGKSRSAGDALTIAGHNGHSNELAALARKIIAHEAGVQNVFNTKRIQIGSLDVTNRAIVQYCADHDLTEHLRFSQRMKYQAVTDALIPAEYAFFHWMLGRVDMKAAETFLQKLATLEDVSADSPIRVLLQKLTRSAVRLDGKMKLHAVVTAWNAFRTGKKINSIQVGRLESEDAMPIAV